MERYKDHNALFAFGLCNEQGDGYISHSEHARRRFSNWLKKKYGSIEQLNQAWATQRWCRKLSSFDDVELQDNEVAMGAPEAWLDMRRFFSDSVDDFISSLKELVEVKAPDVPHSSNHYSEKESFGFDYLKAYPRFVDYPGMGFYPGYTSGKNHAWINSFPTYMERISENKKPMWLLEFITGYVGVYCGTYGMDRMHAFLCLLHRTQMILGWTFRSMLNGEEQFLYGLLDHDGTPNQNYYEYTQIAADFKKLEPYAFPYLPEPQIAVAVSFDSKLIVSYHTSQFRIQYSKMIAETTGLLEKANYDYNIVDLRNLKNNYQLMFIPGYVVMDEDSADTVRRFVENGGTVVMTGYSAVMDATGKVFSEPRPGRLSDVFGIKIEGFYRTSGIELSDEEESHIHRNPENQHELLEIERNNESIIIDVDYYESIKLQTADTYAHVKGKKLCAISKNQYGNGTAYYVCCEPNEAIMEWLFLKIRREAGVDAAISAPDGICARKIAEHQYFYVNTTGRNVTIPLPCKGRGVLKEKDYEKEFILNPYDGELIIISDLYEFWN